MADNRLNLVQIVGVFQNIVKRKMPYNETNLHYEYFEIAGDTIPFKTYGYQTLREFIEQNAGEHFYFIDCAGNSVYIAPRRMENTPNKSKNNNTTTQSKASASNMAKNESRMEANRAQMKLLESKLNAIQSQRLMKMEKSYDQALVLSEVNKTDKIDKIHVDGLKKAKCVSENMHFSSPQSTGLRNPFQNVRNDLVVSVNCQTEKREIGHFLDMDTEMTDDDPTPKKIYFPWAERYWHMKITHAVSTDEIWARFYDEFEVRCGEGS